MPPKSHIDSKNPPVCDGPVIERLIIRYVEGILVVYELNVPGDIGVADPVLRGRPKGFMLFPPPYAASLFMLRSGSVCGPKRPVHALRA